MPPVASRCRRRLLTWFDRHRRDLPWRRDRDPYRIWLSEIMLQQTQVAAVIPYFLRFIKTIPTLKALADADARQVFQFWEGLGYYRRARHLHQAAKEIVKKHGGRLPADALSLRQLPGIGRYMAGAILSQAFDQRTPILEANTIRVLTRLFGWKGDPRRGDLQKKLWQTAEQLLPRQRSGDFNQALMELGQTVCNVRKPRCESCPLSKDCVAHEKNWQQRIPFKRKKKAIVVVAEAAVIVRHRERVLLLQRPDHGRWAGLWEFPHGKVNADEPAADAAQRIVLDQCGLRVQIGPSLGVIRHGIMHYQISMTCLEARSRQARLQMNSHARSEWVKPGELGHYPMSTPQRRLTSLGNLR